MRFAIKDTSDISFFKIILRASSRRSIYLCVLRSVSYYIRGHKIRLKYEAQLKSTLMAWSQGCRVNVLIPLAPLASSLVLD